jgi:hypothetical protein
MAIPELIEQVAAEPLPLSREGARRRHSEHFAT